MNILGRLKTWMSRVEVFWCRCSCLFIAEERVVCTDLVSIVFIMFIIILYLPMHEIRVACASAYSILLCAAANTCAHLIADVCVCHRFVAASWLHVLCFDGLLFVYILLWQLLIHSVWLSAVPCNMIIDTSFFLINIFAD